MLLRCQGGSQATQPVMLVATQAQQKQEKAAGARRKHGGETLQVSPAVVPETLEPSVPEGSRVTKKKEMPWM